MQKVMYGNGLGHIDNNTDGHFTKAGSTYIQCDRSGYLVEKKYFENKGKNFALVGKM